MTKVTSYTQAQDLKELDKFLTNFGVTSPKAWRGIDRRYEYGVHFHVHRDWRKTTPTKMPSATSPPKSILKPSPAVSKDAPTPPTLSREERNRQLALHHAYLLQSRKDIEARNLASTETLLDLPSSPSALPSEPSATDIQVLKDALRSFQPSDFDALIEERNIDHKCGYIFCPKENRSQNASGEYHIVTGRKMTEFKVVRSRELERWCSDECGKMGLYLRVQLSEEPAWTREWRAGGSLELYHEKMKREASGNDLSRSVPPEIKVTGPEATAQDMQERMKDLAVERGDKSNINRASTKFAIRVKENEQRGQSAPAPPSTEDNHEGSIEGYVPKGKHDMNRATGQEEDVEDIMPTI
ncbi:MAG: hypothetical protein L6R39_002908 [Caloplaca ligustica]|nr:MAG: hypothetical protein L6R39_002908 [Caloplaca ligustica]